MILSNVHNMFHQKCTVATSMIRISNIFFDNNVNYNNYNYTSDIHTCVINGAFLIIFKAFEEFLEKSFICYMLGQQGINNNSFVRYVNPISEEHAFNILKGFYKYPDFTNREAIITLANNFFDNGGSYTILQNFNKIFEDIKKIRNAITHISKDSDDKFKNMVRSELGALPQGCNTATFLNTLEINSNQQYIIFYRDHMKIVVDRIANPT